MEDWMGLRVAEWNYEEQDIYGVKTEILNILKKQKISLSQTRLLFRDILNDIEDRNPIVL